MRTRLCRTLIRGRWWNLAALSRSAIAAGAIWTRQSEDLNVNLLVFASGEGVAEHVNSEVDVLLVGIAGTGAVTIDGTRQILQRRTRDCRSQRREPRHPEYERPLRLPHLSPPPRRSLAAHLKRLTNGVSFRVTSRNLVVPACGLTSLTRTVVSG